MGKAREYYSADLYRYFGGSVPFRVRILKPLEIKYIIAMRRASFANNPVTKVYYVLRLRVLANKSHIQIHPATKIGKGFYIGHTGRVIINSRTTIGSNVNVATGVTIGQTNRGSLEGAPTIGDHVWIGTNAVIVGNITVGSDVLIAPNAYVNFDVPDHSVVLGNPAVIRPSGNATESYISRAV